jgi:hypothetical protein
MAEIEQKSNTTSQTESQTRKWSDIVTVSKQLGNTCDAINEKGRKCTRRRKDSTIYCGKHKNVNDHTFEPTVTVTLQVWDGIPYYVDRSGIVFSYSIDNIRMVGYIDPVTQKIVKVDYES